MVGYDLEVGYHCLLRSYFLSVPFTPDCTRFALESTLLGSSRIILVKLNVGILMT
jgi:hypothetical protein